jgi:hypothetical protein
VRIPFTVLLLIPILTFAKEQERTLPCDDSKPQVVHVGLGRITVLSFPLAPKEVLPGENVFDFKQIKNDLAIKALRGTSRTNVVVYLQERRCAFDLVAVQGRGDDIISIRDPKDRRLDLKFEQ